MREAVGYDERASREVAPEVEYPLWHRDLIIEGTCRCRNHTSRAGQFHFPRLKRYGHLVTHLDVQSASIAGCGDAPGKPCSAERVLDSVPYILPQGFLASIPMYYRSWVVQHYRKAL